MRLAIGPDGEWVVILDVEAEECHVRDLLSGETRSVGRSALSVMDAVSLHEVGAAVSDSIQPSVAPIRTARAWGLVLIVGAASSVAVRALLDTTSECESDLNGLLTELEAGDVLARTDVAGERAYELSGAGRTAVETLWSASE